MAGITHLGVGLAAKRIAPQIPVGWLILAAYAIDVIWAVFYFAGIERPPAPDSPTANPWSHGLLMAGVWSLLIGLAVYGLARSRLSAQARQYGLVIGGLVFSHWIVDFISHPMTAAFPGDTGLPLLFDGLPLVGLGVWRTTLGMNLGEYVPLALGLAIYLVTLYQLRRAKTTRQPVPV